MRDQLTVRKVPAGIAGVLQELELRQPLVVTTSLLTDVMAGLDTELTPAAAAERLVREGWLLPLRTRDAWEFVPAARAGRFASGDPWLELRAVLTHRPDAPVAVAFGTAVWSRGHSRHPPHQPVLGYRQPWRPPRSLDHLTAVRYEWQVDATPVNGIPTWQQATIVVAAAALSRHYTDWANADTWLPETMQAAPRHDILLEAERRSTATLIRLAYLAQWSNRPDIVEELRPQLPDQLPVTYLGPRHPRGRWIPEWHLYDALLPDR